MKSCTRDGNVFFKTYNVPKQEKWSTKPTLANYLRKTFVAWDPEFQYDITIENEQCYSCKAYSLTFEEFSMPRVVHDLECEYLFVYAIYRCKTCKVTVSTTDEEKMHMIVPTEILLNCPVTLFNTTAWDTKLVSMMFDLLNGHSNVSDFTNLVSKARTMMVTMEDHSLLSVRGGYPTYRSTITWRRSPRNRVTHCRWVCARSLVVCQFLPPPLNCKSPIYCVCFVLND